MKQMRLAHGALAKVPGLLFYKLLGSGGGNGFSVVPDFSTYAFLGVWSDRNSCEHFMSEHSLRSQALERCQHHWTVLLSPSQVKGSWDTIQPFRINAPHDGRGPIAILTRASIYPGKLLSFWRNVPRVSRRLGQRQPGLLFSKGIGEVPLIQQATFSLWQDREAMLNYAYRGDAHREMIRKTQSLGWYREELFAEFVPLEVRGNWPTLNQIIRPQEKEITSEE